MAVSPSIDSIFSGEYTIYGPSPTCSSNTDSESVLSSLSIYSSKFSNGESVYTADPFPYQLEQEPSPEGDDIPVDLPTEVHTRQLGPC